MSPVLSSLAALMLIQNAPAKAVRQESNTSGYVLRAQWGFSCPTDRIGADGQPLCRAKHYDAPFSVERTDSGMQMTFLGNCFSKKYERKYTQSIDVFVRLKPGASKESIAKSFNQAFRSPPKSPNPECEYFSDFEIDQRQLPGMIEAVFLEKKLPY
jgi:hypothetical protein